MTDSPCLKALNDQRGLDPHAVARASEILSSAIPSITCARKDGSARLVALNLARILGRIFNRIHLAIDDIPLDGEIRADLRRINPHVEVCDTYDLQYVISVGKARADAFFVDASGWRVCVASPGQNHDLLDPIEGANPASALLGAALVAARLLSDFPNLVEARPRVETSRVNLWHPDWNQKGPALPQQLKIDIHGFGHGSISNAAWGALADLPILKGQLVVVDHDAYQDRNLPRYVFLPPTQVGHSKVADLRTVMQHHAELDVVAKAQRIQDWTKANAEQPRLAFISPDNRIARAWATDTQPALAVSANASDREAQVALCNTKGGICAYCLFAPLNTQAASQRDAIVAFTGLSLLEVIRFTNEWNGRTSEPLNEPSLRTMEAKLGKTPGSLKHWLGKRLLEFLQVHQAAFYSAAALKTAGADRLHMPMPLTSAAAGAMALAGILRMTLAGFDQNSCGFNHLSLDIWTGELRFIIERPPEILTCLCQHPSRRVSSQG